MDVLIPDTTESAARAVALRLALAGHTIHTCRHDEAASACAVLDEDGPCPLDTAPIDVAVDVSPAPGARGPGARGPGDGAVCALVRRIPLVLVDPPPDHRLLPWAVDAVDATDIVAGVADVGAGDLPEHTEVATRAMLGELHRQGSEGLTTRVVVRRDAGGLVVELWPDPAMTRTQAARLATHITQAVRSHDRWARTIDATVHDDGSRSPR